MGNAFITKGSTIQIGAGSDDIKAVVIEDFEIGVGEQASEKVEASDGTQYTFAGQQDDNDIEATVIITDSDVTAILDSIYDAGTTIAGGTEWELRNAGLTVNNITITTPATSSGKTMTYVAVNAKGVVFRPTFKLSRGFETKIKYICDYWKAQLTE